MTGVGVHRKLSQESSYHDMEVTASDAGVEWPPSVEALFESAAEAFGAAAIGVILTGMDDGLEGAGAIRSKGGQLLERVTQTVLSWL